MRQYEVTYTVNNRRAQSVITANAPTDAKRIIIAQYHDLKVVIINCRDLKTGYYC